MWLSADRRFRAATIVSSVAGAVAMATWILGATPGSAAVPPPAGMLLVVHADDPLSAAAVLTNNTGADCQAATTSLGTVGITSLSQGGKAVTPTATDPSFPEGLDVYLAGQLTTLAPGRSVTIPLRAAPIGGGHALLTVTWSPLASLGEIYPVAATGALRIAATYALPPLAVSGAPLCPAAATAGALTLQPAAASGGPSTVMIIGLVVGALLLIAVIVLIVLLGRRGRRRGTTAGAAVLLVAAVLATPLWSPRPAYATVSVDPSLQSAFNTCLGNLTMAGGDPAGVLPVLNDPSKTVQIVPSNGDQTHEIMAGGTIIIFWDLNDHHAYSGGGNADPCTSLYHEMYHGKEDLTGGQDHSPCVTAAGDSGLPVNEVNATKAQNILRVKLGLPPRKTYGNTPLPSGPCLPKDQQPPPKRACTGNNCGDSNADPHLTTFDGLRYNFQAVGEFVATRQDGDPGFQVQVRQQPVLGSTMFAVNTAIAADVAGDKVEIDLNPDGMKLLVNGAAAEPGPLPRGGSVALDATAAPAWLVTTWPDGSRAVVSAIGPWGLHLTVQPANARAGKLAGLLGDYNGSPGNDLRAGTGPALPATPDFQQLYPSYADAWRITDATSLFTYPKGASTATYTDRSFPARPVELSSMAAAPAARQLCQLYRITDPKTLEDCTTDVAATGQAAFAPANLSTQDIVQSSSGPSAPPTVGPTSTSTLGPASREATLTVTTPHAKATLSFTATAGQRLYVAILSSTLHGGCGVLNLIEPDGTTQDIGCVNSSGVGDMGGDLLTRTGTYALVFDPGDAGTGQMRVRLIFSTDVHAAIPADGTPTPVGITTPGQVAYLTFDGVAGQRVLIEANDVTVPSGCGVPALRDPNGATITLGCLSPQGVGLVDGILLRTTGQYTVVVDPGDDGTGQMTLKLIVSQDQHGTITLGGPPVVAHITSPGQVAYFSFTGTKGQKVKVVVTASTVTPACGLPSLIAPDNSTLAIGCTSAGGTGGIDPVTLPSGGTYNIGVDLAELQTGDVTLELRAG